MNTKSIFLLSSIILVANIAFAEPAPVYDADSMFDQSMAEQQQQQQPPQPPQQDLPPPPSPDQDSTFVPMQNEASNQINNDATNVSAPAQNPADRPSRPLTTDQRIKRLEHIIDLIQNSEGTAQVDSLQNQVQELRAQVEGLTRQLQQLQAQQKAAPVDASKPVSTPAPAAAATTTTPAAPTPVKYSSLDDEVNSKLTTKPATVSKTAANNQPNVAEEQQIYQTAYNLIKAKKFAEAATTLQNMLHKYPSGQFASNAHYWLGELYGVMGKNDLALNEFSTVVKNYSDSPRVSDAQLKLGLIYSAQSKWSDAKAAFKRVINRYPGTTSARLAMEQLKQIKSAGH